MKTLALLLLVFFSSCSYLPFWDNEDQARTIWTSKTSLYKREDYRDHLASFSKDYIQNSENNCYRAVGNDYKYLEGLYKKIVLKNILILGEIKKPKFFLIERKKPFIFSLPNAQFFISKGLFKRYVTNESLLISLLSFEIVKSHRELYRKRIIIPTGDINLDKMMSFVKIPVSLKIKIDRWAYRIVDRAGFDASAYLNWLQIQNRNALNFSFQLNDLRDITREEYAFKSFLAQKGYFKKKLNLRKISLNSSKQFYQFINHMQRDKK